MIEEHTNLLVISFGFLTFSSVNFLSQFIVPTSAVAKQWKWRNTATSFVHSFITGIWSSLCFYQVSLLQEANNLQEYNIYVSKVYLKDNLFRHQKCWTTQSSSSQTQVKLWSVSPLDTSFLTPAT